MIGGGFIGCEVASLCGSTGCGRPWSNPVRRCCRASSAARWAASSGRSTKAGRRPALRQRGRVAWRARTARLVRAHLTDGTRIEADVAVIALGPSATPNGSTGPASRPIRAASIATRRALCPRPDGQPDLRIAAAGDVARFPPSALWRPARRAGALEPRRRAGNPAGRLLAGVKPEVSLRRAADLLVDAGRRGGQIRRADHGGGCRGLHQGEPGSGRFVAVYGREGRCVAAVSVDSARWLPAHAELVATAAPFPPHGAAADRPARGITILAPGFA